MAFNQDNFAKISSGYAHIVSPQMFSYLGVTDDIAAILVPGYFDKVNAETQIVRVGDLFLIDPAGEKPILVTVILLAPIELGAAINTASLEDGTVTTPKLANLAVTTPKIEDLAVTKAKLAANIQPFSVSVHHSHAQTVGGAAIEIFAVSGILASDFVFATMESPGTSTPVIVDSFGQSNAIRVRFSVDPGNDTFVLLNAFRAT